MSKKLSVSDIEKWEASNKETKKLEKVIWDRVGYVYSTIYKTFGKKLQNWYMFDAQEDSRGDFSEVINLKRLNTKNTMMDSLELYPDNIRDERIIDRDGKEHSFEEGEFPLRWLIEDFEKEFADGVKLYKKQQSDAEAERTKGKTPKQLKQEALKQKLSHLSKAELKLIDFK